MVDGVVDRVQNRIEDAFTAARRVARIPVAKDFLDQEREGGYADAQVEEFGHVDAHVRDVGAY